MSEAPVGSRGGVGPSTCQMTSSCCMALAGSRTAAGDAQVIQSVWTGWGQLLARSCIRSQVRGSRGSMCCWCELKECYSDTTRTVCDTNLSTEGATGVTPQSHQSVSLYHMTLGTGSVAANGTHTACA